jgi:hypothetical protein
MNTVIFQASSTAVRSASNKIFPVHAATLLRVQAIRSLGVSRCCFDVSTVLRRAYLLLFNVDC